MAMEYTEEQLNHFDKSTLVQLFLVQQSQLKDIDQKLQLLLEQVAVLNNKRFGKSSEKLGVDNQICFMEVDGNIVFFNEAEAVAALDESEEEPVKKQLFYGTCNGFRGGLLWILFYGVCRLLYERTQ